MVGIVRDDDEAGPRVRRRARTSSGRSRSTRGQGRARLRHHRPARDVRDLARRRRGRAAARPVTRPTSSRWLRAARDGQRADAGAWLPLVVLGARRRGRGRGARRAVAARRLAAARAAAGSPRARVPGVHGRVGGRQQRAGVARDPRRHRATGSRRGEYDAEIRDAYVAHLRRARPADAGQRRDRRRRVGAARGRARARRAAASCVALRRWSPTPAPRRDGRRRASSPRHAEHEHDVSEDTTTSTQLEAERDFLLRSLDDLEAERRGQHRRRDLPRPARRLHRARRGRDPVAATTAPNARAAPTAAPIRRSGSSRSAASSCSRLLRRVPAGARGRARRPGQTITGNAQRRPGRPTVDQRLEARRGRGASPTSYAARIALRPVPARHATSPTRSTVRRGRPARPEPARAPTYAGWIARARAQQVTSGRQRDLLASALELERGITSTRLPRRPLFRASTAHAGRAAADAIPDVPAVPRARADDSPAPPAGARGARRSGDADDARYCRPNP